MVCTRKTGKMGYGSNENDRYGLKDKVEQNVGHTEHV